MYIREGIHWSGDRALVYAMYFPVRPSGPTNTWDTSVAWIRKGETAPYAMAYKSPTGWQVVHRSDDASLVESPIFVRSENGDTGLVVWKRYKHTHLAKPDLLSWEMLSAVQQAALSAWDNTPPFIHSELKTIINESYDAVHK